MKKYKLLNLLLLVLILATMVSSPQQQFVYADSNEDIARAGASVKSFSDVNKTDYYYDSVMELVDKGVVSGYENNTFRPKNHITWAEALVMVARAAELDTTPLPGGAWYSGVQNWFITNGIIDKNQDMKSTITREALVNVLNELYDVPVYTGVGYFSDTNGIAANNFYHAGIISGYQAPTSTSLGKFGPNNNITRGDICKIICNVINNFKTKSIVKQKSQSISKLTTYPIPKYSMPEGILDSDKVYELAQYLIQNDIDEYMYTVDCTAEEYQEFKEEAKAIIREGWYAAYMDNYYLFFDRGNALSLSTNILGDKAKMTLKITISRTPDSKKYTWKETEEHFEKLFQDMIKTMNVDDSMTTKGKSYAAYQYVDWVLSYDKANSVPFNIDNNSAVCSGYTALYNYMLTRMGIEAHAVLGVHNSVSHVWTIIYDEASDAWYHADTTWGDPVPDKGYGYSGRDFFWLSWEEFSDIDKGRAIDSMKSFHTKRLDPWENFEFPTWIGI